MMTFTGYTEIFETGSAEFKSGSKVGRYTSLFFSLIMKIYKAKISSETHKLPQTPWFWVGGHLNYLFTVIGKAKSSLY